MSFIDNLAAIYTGGEAQTRNSPLPWYGTNPTSKPIVQENSCYDYVWNGYGWTKIIKLSMAV